MSILIDHTSRVLVQGITGRNGRFHTQQMLAYGTRVVAGAKPGTRAEQDGVPIFPTVAEAVAATAADVAIVFVPGGGAAEAILESAEAGLRLIVAITEGIPVLDMVQVLRYLEGRPTRLIGPNCPGLITPGQCKVGIMPGGIHLPGPVGVVSRSGTLTYEVVAQLTALGIGQSTCIGIGGDPLLGTSFLDVLELFEEGGAERMTKPVVAYVAGRSAPPGKRMGHAGAIIEGGRGTAAEKIATLQAAGIAIAASPATIGQTVAARLRPPG